MFKCEDPLLNGKEKAETGTHYRRGKRQRGEIPTGLWYQLHFPIETEYNSLVYTQSLPIPINLNGDLTVEHALMQSYALTTTIPFSN